MSETWKRAPGREEDDGNEGLPKFGRKARLWFARQLNAKLDELRNTYPLHSLTDDEAGLVLARFLDDPSQYIIWVDSKEFSGGRYSYGAWRIHWEGVIEDLREFVREIREDAQRAAIASLDDWLRADLADSLNYKVRDSGSEKLSDEVKERLSETARARRRTWPLRCVDCAHTFFRQPKQKGQAIRCPECVEKRKQPPPTRRRRRT
jgi:DNA-directed RNA polymerase subunit RPC12/RpoP